MLINLHNLIIRLILFPNNHNTSIFEIRSYATRYHHLSLIYLNSKWIRFKWKILNLIVITTFIVLDDIFELNAGSITSQVFLFILYLSIKLFIFPFSFIPPNLKIYLLLNTQVVWWIVPTLHAAILVVYLVYILYF